jgi:hypothetical protein
MSFKWSKKLRHYVWKAPAPAGHACMTLSRQDVLNLRHLKSIGGLGIPFSVCLPGRRFISPALHPFRLVDRSKNVPGGGGVPSFATPSGKQKPHWEEMRKAGMSFRAIAEFSGVSHETIRQSVVNNLTPGRAK